MPAKPRWLLRLPEIINALRALDAPILDRSVLETVFGVRRRRAIELLSRLGGYQVGRTFVVEREAVLRCLERMAAGDGFWFESRRREKLAAILDRVRKEHRGAGIRISPPPEVPAGWPSGVELRPGTLTVGFQDARDLLAKLYGIAQAAAEDFSRFEAAAGGTGTVDPGKTGGPD